MGHSQTSTASRYEVGDAGSAGAAAFFIAGATSRQPQNCRLPELAQELAK
ncbi:MAG: hypothetical protein ACK2UA_19210 [Anaerolineae bacterium]|jgi:hypothetical protein